LAETLLRWLWFEILQFIETYKLRTLGHILFWLLIVWFIGANLILVCERRLPPNSELAARSPYVEPDRQFNYIDTYWWVIITITSAGMEDGAAPQSSGARTVVVIIAVVGICLVTVFTGNVVAIVWERITRSDLIQIKPRIAHVGQYSGHVVICNASAKFEPVLRQIVDKADRQTKMVLVDPKAEEYRTERRPLFRSTFAVSGDPQSLRTLKQADLASAAAMVVLTPDTPGLSVEERDHQALLAALAAQPFAEVNPNLRIVLEVGLRSTLRFTEIFNALDNYPLYIEAICADDFQERLLSQACLTPGLSHLIDLVLTVPARARRGSVSRLRDAILLREGQEEEDEAGPADMANEIYSLPVSEQFVGKRFRDVRSAIEEADAVTVIGYLRWKGGGRGVGVRIPALTLNPSRRPPAPGEPAPIDYPLARDDELLVLARPDAYLTLCQGARHGRRA
jgi:hypothetical protein